GAPEGAHPRRSRLSPSRHPVPRRHAAAAPPARPGGRGGCLRRPLPEPRGGRGCGHRVARIPVRRALGGGARRGLRAGAQAGEAAGGAHQPVVRAGIRYQHAGDPPRRAASGRVGGRGGRPAGHRRHRECRGFAGPRAGCARGGARLRGGARIPARPRAPGRRSRALARHVL
ncbi:MAG: Adenine phosphoribosyltransferase, partial [uncultured Gemmatimonadetes bacterium]